MKPNFAWLILFFLISLTHSGSSKFNSYNEWKNSPNVQYHIQSDEGGERYFKYQTESGQYRKEKRLQDGTVIGTYGWVDSNGYLRLRDYVADKQGYRIIKTKLIYVGKNSVVEEPRLVTPRPTYSSLNHLSQSTLSLGQVAQTEGSTSWGPHSYLSTENNGQNYQAKSVLYSSSAPAADATPAPLPDSLGPRYYDSETSPGITVFRDATGLPHASSAAPSRSEAIDYDSIPPAEFVSGNDPTAESAKADPYGFPSDSPISRKFLQVGRKHDFLPETGHKRVVVVRRRRKNEKRYLDDHEEYDGISTVQNGFRYFLPKHYHEENSSSDGANREGSFGYIDPFGIRRVVYYNASPKKGFLHKKNNRYVGFSATPYDPRPNF